jgi:DNA-binding XRE family transcriptional regulator
MEGTDYKDFERQLLKKPNIRKEYEALKPKYELIRSLIERRNELAISQRELARLIGMKQPAICRLERGDNNITVGTLFRVAKALDLDIEVKPKPLIKA